MNDELEWVQKEAIVTYFKVISQHLPEENEKYEGKIRTVRLSLGHESNPRPPE
jgi:hypothetical protein